MNIVERVLAELYLIIFGEHKIDVNVPAPLLGVGVLVVLVLYIAFRLATRTPPMMQQAPYAVIQMPQAPQPQGGDFINGCAGAALVVVLGLIAIVLIAAYFLLSPFLTSI